MEIMNNCGNKHFLKIGNICLFETIKKKIHSLTFLKIEIFLEFGTFTENLKKVNLRYFENFKFTKKEKLN